MVEGTALWFGAAGFEVLGVAEVDGELVVEVETSTRWARVLVVWDEGGAEGPPVGDAAGLPGGVDACADPVAEAGLVVPGRRL